MDQTYQNWGNLTASEQADFLANYPGILPPEGVVSNFVNPPTRNDIGLSVITIFLVLVVITGALRLYSRIAVVRTLKLEDCESLLMTESKFIGARSHCLPVTRQISASPHMYVSSE
jgi:hypothetical protein